MEQKKDNRAGFLEKLEAGNPYYEIRLESIGGLGANLCGKMLGELGVKYLDVNSSSFSSYGSEKTGTPVKGFVRYCKKEKEIRVHYPVVEPDLLVVFHQTLLKDETVWKGCSEKTTLIVALEQSWELENEEQEQEAKKEQRAEKQRLKTEGKAQNEQSTGQRAAGEKLERMLSGHNFAACYGLEAQKIAMETKSRINVVMLGAALKLIGLKNLEAGEQICQDTLGKKYPDALKGNLEGMRRGYEEVRELKIARDASVSSDRDSVDQKRDTKWGYETAPIGGINPCFGSTVVADLSPSRQGYIPLFIKERCINCGLCYSACPDMVFQFAPGEYKGREMMVNQGLDYYHCKGCLRCVNVCPVNALVRGVEAEHPEKEYFLPNKELLRMPEYYEEAGADGYITSESYLTEKRMEGGEV